MLNGFWSECHRKDGCLCALMIGKIAGVCRNPRGVFACCFLIMRGIKGVGVCIGGFSSPVFESVVTNAFVGVFYLHVLLLKLSKTINPCTVNNHVCLMYRSPVAWKFIDCCEVSPISSLVSGKSPHVFFESPPFAHRHPWVGHHSGALGNKTPRLRPQCGIKS